MTEERPEISDEEQRLAVRLVEQLLSEWHRRGMNPSSMITALLAVGSAASSAIGSDAQTAELLGQMSLAIREGVMARQIAGAKPN